MRTTEIPADEKEIPCLREREAGHREQARVLDFHLHCRNQCQLPKH